MSIKLLSILIIVIAKCIVVPESVTVPAICVNVQLPLIGNTHRLHSTAAVMESVKHSLRRPEDPDALVLPDLSVVKMQDVYARRGESEANAKPNQVCFD